jgi:2-methylisocitrate lyase-like PEP mutase family enzyme
MSQRSLWTRDTAGVGNTKDRGGILDMNRREQLRSRIIGSGPMVIAPGAYDCITARLVEQAGFGAVYMTGAGTAAACGFPDYGLVTMSEMVDNAGRMANAITVPLIADADTGYGNELNVTRTVQEYESRGVAAIHIEDQEFPKRCGHLDDKVVIPTADYVAKIRAAASARRDPDFLIIARTDANAVYGLDEAVERVNLALAAGADIAFVEAPRTVDQMQAIPKMVKGPCLLNLVWAGKTPDVSFSEAEAMGYRLTILPGMLLAGVMVACDELLARTREAKRHAPLPDHMTVHEMFRRMGAEDWDPLRHRFRDGRSTSHAAAE